MLNPSPGDTELGVPRTAMLTAAFPLCLTNVGLPSKTQPIRVGGSEKWGHFGGIVALLPLAATTSGISPGSGPDDSLLYFSLQRSSRTVKPPAR
jgi:hypothetical protein